MVCEMFLTFASESYSNLFDMATIQLRLSKKVGNDGKAQIIVKLTIARNSRPCFKSNVFVNPDYFRPIQETARGVVMGIVTPKKGKLNTADVKETNTAKAEINSFIARLLAVCNAITSHGGEANHETITEALQATDNIPTDSITFDVIQSNKRKTQLMQAKSNMSFFDWYNTFIEDHGKNLSKGRVNRLKVVERMLGRYEAFVRATDKGRKNFRLNIDEIDKETVEDIHDYLVNEKSLSEEYPNIFAKLVKLNPVQQSSDRKQVIGERGRNVMVNHMKVIKEFFNWLNTQGITDNKPFAKIKLEPEKYGTPYYLTLEERNFIADADLSHYRAIVKAAGGKAKEVETLEVQRDIFIFHCCVGCRVSDLIRLTPANIDNGVLTYIPQKTKGESQREVRVPLNNRAISLVEKYQGKDPKGRLFPFISPQKYNDTIKDILRVCGINRVITKPNSVTGAEEQHPIWKVASSHMARRTFVGNLYKEIQDPNLIGSMSGHVVGSKAFARYRAIDDDTKKSVVSLID